MHAAPVHTEDVFVQQHPWRVCLPIPVVAPALNVLFRVQAIMLLTCTNLDVIVDINIEVHCITLLAIVQSPAL